MHSLTVQKNLKSFFFFQFADHMNLREETHTLNEINRTESKTVLQKEMIG